MFAHFLVVLFGLFAFVHSQPFNIAIVNTPQTPDPPYYGVPYGPIYLSGTSISNTWSTTITLTCANCLSIEPSTITLSQDRPRASYWLVINPTSVGGTTVNFAASGGSTLNPPNYGIPPVPRPINFARSSTNRQLNGDSFFVGETKIYSITSLFPIISDLTVTLTSSINVQLNTTTLSFGPGDRIKTFSVRGLAQSNNEQIVVNASGTDLTYSTNPSQTALVSVNQRNIIIPTFPTQVPVNTHFIGVVSSPNGLDTRDVNIVLATSPNVAPDVSSVPLGDPSVSASNVNFTSSVATNNKLLTVSLSGTNANDYTLSNTAANWNVVRRPFAVTQTHTEFYAQYPFPVSVSLPVSPTSTINATAVSANALVNPSFLTFGPGVTSQVVMVTPLKTGEITVEWTFTGTEMVTSFTRPTPAVSFTPVNYGRFYVQPGYPTNLVTGIESVPVVVCLSGVVSTLSSFDVTLTPYTTGWTGAGLQVLFNPPQLTFKKDAALCQSITINVVDPPLAPAGANFTISFAISGKDASYFTAPTIPGTFNVYRRSVQLFTACTTFTLGVSCPLSISLDYLPDQDVQVYLYSPTVSFSANQVGLTAAQPFAEISFTPLFPGTFTISTVVGGNSGGLYLPSAPITSNVNSRSSNLVRVPKQENSLWNIVVATNNFTLNYADSLPTFFKFTLSDPVVNSLTITPLATHLTFVPSPLTLSPGATEVNFEVRGVVGGNHFARFALSGPDASLYSIPAAQTFTVRKGGLTPFYELNSSSLVSFNLFLVLILSLVLLF